MERGMKPKIGDFAALNSGGGNFQIVDFNAREITVAWNGEGGPEEVSFHAVCLTNIENGEKYGATS